MLFGQGAGFMGIVAIGNNRMVSAGVRKWVRLLVGSGFDGWG